MKFFKIKNLNKTPILLNIPHSSTKIPTNYLKDYLLSKKDLSYEKNSMADLHTEKLFSKIAKKYDSITMDVSRVFVDIERFSDEKKEPMSKVGMPAIYTLTQEGKHLRKIETKRKTELLEKVYDPFHISLDKISLQKLTKFGKCIIFDCHSFPSEPRKYEPDQGNNRPDICIGVDKFHTPKKLETILVDEFKIQGFKVLVNSPFSGSIVPNLFYKKNKNVVSVMIEINRKLYMDEKSFKKNKNFKKIADSISVVLNKTISELNLIWNTK